MSLKVIPQIWRMYSEYRWHVAVLVVVGLLSAVLEGIGINAVVPMVSFFTGGGVPTDFISQTIFNFFQFLHIPFTFRYLLGFVLVLFFLRAAFQVLFGFIRGWITADYMARESADVLQGTLSASWPYLLRQKMGTMQNTAIRDVQQSCSLLVAQVQFIQSGTGLLMYLLVAANISPLTTLLTLMGGAVLMLVIRPLLLRTNRMGAEASATEKNVAQFLSEHIVGMKVVKAAGIEARAIETGHRFIKQLRALAIRMSAVQSLSAGLFQPFSIVFVVILFAITYRAPGFSIVSFAATLYLIQKIFTYLDSAQSALHGMSSFLPYAQNVQAFKRMLREHREVSGPEGKPLSLQHSIEFTDVEFSYTADRPVLSGVNFTIVRGTTVALIGPSGAGKTSVADLLLRLFEPTAGRILVDGEHASRIPLASWRRAVGYVSQEVFLLNGTIAENIRFYRPELSHDEVVVAARQANIHTFIESLPQQYETMVGDRGVMLSGGQRQRIALARALAGKPQLLVLDEATSALDTESERLIQEAIAALRGRVTVFVIAHRLSTIEHADRIMVLVGGSIAEQGTPEELLADPNSYFSTHR